jgi:hypothetical protein
VLTMSMARTQINEWVKAIDDAPFVIAAEIVAPTLTPVEFKHLVQIGPAIPVPAMCGLTWGCSEYVHTDLQVKVFVHKVLFEHMGQNAVGKWSLPRPLIGNLLGLSKCFEHAHPVIANIPTTMIVKERSVEGRRANSADVPGAATSPATNVPTPGPTRAPTPGSAQKGATPLQGQLQSAPDASKAPLSAVPELASPGGSVTPPADLLDAINVINASPDKALLLSAAHVKEVWLFANMNGMLTDHLRLVLKHAIATGGKALQTPEPFMSLVERANSMEQLQDLWIRFQTHPQCTAARQAIQDKVRHFRTLQQQHAVMPNTPSGSYGATQQLSPMHQGMNTPARAVLNSLSGIGQSYDRYNYDPRLGAAHQEHSQYQQPQVALGYALT